MVMAMDIRTKATPNVVDGSALRTVFAGVPSAVAVVTVGGHSERYGATIGSLISLSLDPPLLGFAVRRGSGLLARLSFGARFGVSVLAAGQERTATNFAASEPDRFAQTVWCDDNGIARIDGSVAWLRAEVSARYVAGDHEIVVGLVTAAERESRAALLFAEHGFHTFVTTTSRQRPCPCGQHDEEHE